MKKPASKKQKFYIYIFRHGQTTYNRDGKFTGWNNPDLTNKGILNAKSVGKQLKNKKIDIAIHSGLKRAKHTLDFVLKDHPECKRVLLDKRMRESNYGKLNGMTHEEFIKNIGHQLYSLEIQGDAIYDFDNPKMKKKVEAFLGEEEYDEIHRGWDIPPPGGESFAMVEKRVSPFLKELIKRIKKEKVNVAISAHGNSIRLFRKIMEKATIPETVRWVIPYDKPYVYQIEV